MTATPPDERGEGGGGSVGAWLERGAFFVLLLIVGMRPLLSETYESGAGLFAEYLRGADVTTPAMTAGFDVAIWAAAVAVAVAGVLRRKLAASPFRWTGIEVGWLVMVVAAAVSTAVAASNKRLALNASVDWLTAGALAMTLARLCSDRLRVAMVLGVIAAAGATTTVKSVMQVASEYRLTREDYQQNKDKLWRDVPSDDPRVLLYERRLAANEATGFLSHSNAAGSLLMVCGFAAVAAGGLTGVRGARWGLVAGGAAMVAGIVLTGSKGAFLATGAGVGLLAVLHALRVVARRRWRAALALGWGAIVAGVIGVAAFGIARGGLPGASLAFRWNYWEVTAKIVGQHPLAGVGALNFDRAYLPLKPIDFPEEIRDPHNFLLAILAQWGVPGLAGMIAVLVGASMVAARRWAEDAEDVAAEPATAEVARSALRHWVPGVILGFVALRIWVLSGLMGTASGQATIFLDVIQYVSVWAAVFALVVAMSLRGGRPAGWNWRLVALCGAAAFLLHNTIDFAIFLPGPATVLAALGAVAVAQGSGFRRPEALFGLPIQAPSRVQGSGTAMRGTAGPIGRLVAAGVGLVLTLTLVYAPVSGTAAALDRARGANLDVARGYYAEAAEIDAFDPVPLAEMAERLARDAAPEHVDAAIAALKEAMGRDPLQLSLHRWLGQFYVLRYQVHGEAADLKAGVAAMRRVLELYPQSPEEHVNLAAMLALAASATGSAEWAQEARAEYAKGLEIDAARPGLDEVRKWTEKRRGEVERAMQAVGQAATRPA